jgi:hypothetical protein
MLGLFPHFFVFQAPEYIIQLLVEVMVYYMYIH